MTAKPSLNVRLRTVVFARVDQKVTVSQLHATSPPRANKLTAFM
jgi:hypothetical protein